MREHAFKKALYLGVFHYSGDLKSGLFEDLISNSLVFKGWAVAMVEAIQNLYVLSRFQVFFEKLWQFVLISNGRAYGFQIAFKIWTIWKQGICNTEHKMQQSKIPVLLTAAFCVLYYNLNNNYTWLIPTNKCCWCFVVAWSHWTAVLGKKITLLILVRKLGLAYLTFKRIWSKY